jgi:serine/threonine protein phosphatase 1
MATVAIGDIHGNIAALRDLLETVVPELTTDDTLVFLGDYVDRGADTKSCVEEILRLERECSFSVVELLGNHEEWMLATMHDYSRHSWLFNIEAFDTIASYSPEAAQRLRSEMENTGPALLTEQVRLPYNLFFDAIPQTHVEFFENLKLVYGSEDVLCVHGGLNPDVESLEAQRPRDIIWGCYGFPERYHGEQAVVYGHKNFHEVDERGWPMPHILDNATFGIDTISSGVLTAMRFPNRQISQSRRLREKSVYE